MSERKEYIERGALMEEIQKHIGTIGANAERLVARFPAADVEPVVRCEDCARGTKLDKCGKYVWCRVTGNGFSLDHFCAMGTQDGKER